MRLAAPITLLALLAALLAGCGDSSPEEREGGATAPRQAEPSPERVDPPPGASVRACRPAPALEVLRVTGVGCEEARAVVAAWRSDPACALGARSRRGCTVGSYRCAVVATARGISGGCGKPGRSIGFALRRG
jgi:hypothetical protein